MQTRVLFVFTIIGVMDGLFSAQADDQSTDEAVKKEIAALKGAWKITSRVEDGKETNADKIKDRVITFEEEKYTIRDGKAIFVQATFKIDPSKNPKWFDLTITNVDNAFKGITQLGIYKIEGDTVTFCIGEGSHRPEDFYAKEGSGRILTTYKRIKK